MMKRVIIQKSFFFGALVKAGGKRVAKKGLEEASSNHGTPEKETKRPDKPRSARLALAE